MITRTPYFASKICDYFSRKVTIGQAPCRTGHDEKIEDVVVEEGDVDEYIHPQYDEVKAFLFGGGPFKSSQDDVRIFVHNRWVVLGIRGGHHRPSTTSFE